MHNNNKNKSNNKNNDKNKNNYDIMLLRMSEDGEGCKGLKD